MRPVSSAARIAGVADHRKAAAGRRTRLCAASVRAHMRRERRITAMVEAMRMDITKLAPEAYKHLLQLEQAIAGKVDKKLYHLIKLRASQINGCAFCIGMHSDEALRDGDAPERLLLLDAWHESSAFSEKERAALEWVEEVTLIADSHASKEAFDGLKRFFSEEEIAYVTLAAALINTWNRIAISSRAQYDREQFRQRVGETKVSEPA
jgi:AhpD family alkylhydroperoxidase